MKNSRTMVALAALVMLVAAVVPVLAQDTWNGQDFECKFTVPMAFYAGDKLMPAGTYEVKQGTMEQGQTLFISGKGKNETYVQYTAATSDQPLKKLEVTFNKYGDKEFLHAIKWPGGGGGTVTQKSWIITLNQSSTEAAAAKAAAAANHSVAATSSKKKQ